MHPTTCGLDSPLYTPEQHLRREVACSSNGRRERSRQPSLRRASCFVPDNFELRPNEWSRQPRVEYMVRHQVLISSTNS